MRSTLWRKALIGLSTFLTGCSSLNNVGLGLGGPNAGDCQPFGGVVESSSRIVEGVDSLQRGGLQFYIPVLTECVCVAVLADVPLSLAGDILTLPFCVYCMSKMPPAPAPMPPQESPALPAPGLPAAYPQPLPQDGRTP